MRDKIINREKRRKFEKNLVKKGYSKDSAKRVASHFAPLDKTMTVGERVRIKPESVAKYGNLKMKKWCEERLDIIFTLKEADEYKNGLRIWTFEECTADGVDWLFSELDLVKVKD